ncbi:MAG: hypothetical protein Q8916_13770 [Bacteroidota bacterium]|nr:hypothetical protein [Bacteroidota bacterium]
MAEVRGSGTENSQRSNGKGKGDSGKILGKGTKAKETRQIDLFNEPNPQK